MPVVPAIPAEASSNPAGKSPSGRIPMMVSVFKLIMRPRMCSPVRCCSSDTAVTEIALSAAPSTTSAETIAAKDATTDGEGVDGA